MLTAPLLSLVRVRRVQRSPLNSVLTEGKTRSVSTGIPTNTEIEIIPVLTACIRGYTSTQRFFRKHLNCGAYARWISGAYAMGWWVVGIVRAHGLPSTFPPPIRQRRRRAGSTSSPKGREGAGQGRVGFPLLAYPDCSPPPPRALAVRCMIIPGSGMRVFHGLPGCHSVLRDEHQPGTGCSLAWPSARSVFRHYGQVT